MTEIKTSLERLSMFLSFWNMTTRAEDQLKRLQKNDSNGCFVGGNSSLICSSLNQTKMRALAFCKTLMPYTHVQYVSDDMFHDVSLARTHCSGHTGLLLLAQKYKHFMTN